MGRLGDLSQWRTRMAVLALVGASHALFFAIDRSRTTSRWPGGVLIPLLLLLALAVVAFIASGALVIRAEERVPSFIVVLCFLLSFLTPLFADSAIEAQAWLERGVAQHCVSVAEREEGGTDGPEYVADLQCPGGVLVRLTSSEPGTAGATYEVWFDPRGILEPGWPLSAGGIRFVRVLGGAGAATLILTSLACALVPNRALRVPYSAPVGAIPFRDRP